MTDDEPTGEMREHARHASRQMLFAVLVLLGGLIAAGFIAFNTDMASVMQGSIPPAVAVILALVFAVAVLWGSIAYRKRIDEVALNNNIYAGSWGAFVVLVGYPLWFLLWKGNLLPEPSHMIIYGTLYLVICGTYVFRTYR